MLTAVILTRDEERHLARAIASIAGIADRFFVIDSGSTDRTAEIALECGATVLVHPWINYAQQLNWALEHLPPDTEWILRLDADEIVGRRLAEEIALLLPKLPAEIDGVVVRRRMAFMGRPIRHGGIFPTQALRLFRHGKGRCEDRWMDEHIQVAGPVAHFPGELLDDSLQPLSWWTAKHNSYASREVVDILNREYAFWTADTAAAQLQGGARRIRWLKEQVYGRLPAVLRPFLYFVYRYVVRAGFLDGREGLAFHVLQGFWYRFLVDMKLAEVRTCIARGETDPKEAIRRVLGIDVSTPS